MPLIPISLLEKRLIFATTPTDGDADSFGDRFTVLPITGGVREKGTRYLVVAVARIEGYSDRGRSPLYNLGESGGSAVVVRRTVEDIVVVAAVVWASVVVVGRVVDGLWIFVAVMVGAVEGDVSESFAIA